MTECVVSRSWLCKEDVVLNFLLQVGELVRCLNFTRCAISLPQHAIGSTAVGVTLIHHAAILTLLLGLTDLGAHSTHHIKRQIVLECLDEHLRVAHMDTLDGILTGKQFIIL